MIKLMTVISTVALMSMSSSYAGAQTVRSVQDEGKGLGSADWFAYVDIDKLQPHIKRNKGGILESYSANLKPDSFYLKWKWSPSDCWARSVLREGVVAYCFPYARLGYQLRTENYPMPAEGFLSVGGVGLYVWHEPEKNFFYLWSSWNYEYVLGPFVGDPIESLKNAVKPSKGKRYFYGVSLTLVSQRWVYPDEEKARMPRNDHYDCVHGHASGRAIEQVQLNSFITRLRLTNYSDLKLYYLTQSSESDKPAGYALNKYRERPDWERSISSLRYREFGPLTLWHQLPRGGVVEFDVTNTGWPGAEHGFVVVLNDEPVFWDEVEIKGTYPTMYRKFTDE